MKKIIIGVISVLIIIILIIFNNKHELKAKDYKNVIDNINISIQEVKSLVNGDLITVKIKNNSKFKIYSNKLFFNYPLKDGNGYTENKYKVEALVNKKQIKSGEEIIVSILIPIGDFIKEDSMAKNLLYYDYEGYINEVSNKNSFFINNYIPIP